MTKAHSSITNKQALPKLERKQSFSCIKVRLSSPKSMIKRPSFLLWLRLRLLVAFGEGIWGFRRCNSVMDFFWVVKLLRLSIRLHDAQLWIVFSFKYRSVALCMILRDYSWLVSLFLLWPRRRTLYSRPCQVRAAPSFVSRYIFQDGGIGTSFGGLSFINCFVTTYIYSKGQSWALELLRLKLPGTWKHVPWWLWICFCGFSLIVCFGLTRHDTDLEQMLK